MLVSECTTISAVPIKAQANGELQPFHTGHVATCTGVNMDDNASCTEQQLLDNLPAQIAIRLETLFLRSQDHLLRAIRIGPDG